MLLCYLKPIDELPNRKGSIEALGCVTVLPEAHRQTSQLQRVPGKTMREGVAFSTQSTIQLGGNFLYI